MWTLISSSACTVIFFWLRRGPASLTILRRNVSPEASRNSVDEEDDHDLAEEDRQADGSRSRGSRGR